MAGRKKKPGKGGPKGRAGNRKHRYRVVAQDRDLLVVDKPAGLLTVPVPGLKASNLLNQLNEERPGGAPEIKNAHRIDRFTSGLVLFARNARAHRHLVRQFRERQPERIYLALVRGHLPDDEGHLVHHLKQVSRGFRNIVVDPSDPEGSRAGLRYTCVERFPDTTLVRVQLETGLKNQIRVQMAEIGHPLVGDRHYAEQERNEPLIDRQALHASELSCLHPATGRSVHFKASLPDDMKKLLAYYRRHSFDF